MTKHKNFTIHVRNILQIIISCVYSIRGWIVYKKITAEQNLQDVEMYIYDYAGMGDVYVLSLYYNEVARRNPTQKMCLVVKGGVCGKVARMCGIKNVAVITKLQMKMLVYFARIPRFSDDYIHVITPFPQRLVTDIYSHYLYGKKINMADAYRCIMFGLADGEFSYPIIERREDKISAFFSENGLRKDNTVIISPYANTVNEFPIDLFEILAGKLKNLGFDVCTNASSSEQGIPGTKKVFFDLKDAEHIVNDAGYFLGMRSGLCDVVCNSDAYKCVLYPDYWILNSSLYDFCSFKKMRIGKNISEINWDFCDYDTLVNLVVSKFIHAKLARELAI